MPHGKYHKSTTRDVMYESIEEVLEELEKMLEYIEDVNFDDTYHLALEHGAEFRDELRTSNNDRP